MSFAAVPCQGCTLCCRNELILLHPSDNPALYDAEPVIHPLTGQPAMALKHKPNGDCVYLGEGGCTIHPHHPLICRMFDCGLAYAMLDRAERRRRVKSGLFSQDKLDQGRRVQQLRGAL